MFFYNKYQIGTLFFAQITIFALMKRYFKIFFISASMVLGIQLFGALAFRLAEGTVIQYPIPIVFMLLCLAAPLLYISKSFGIADEQNGVNGVLIPLLPCSILAVYIMIRPPKPLWIVLFVTNLFLIALAVFVALRFSERKTKKTIQEQDAFRKTAATVLNRFKTSYNKQYVVLSNIDAKDVLYEMRDGCFLFQLPDNRLFVLVKQPLRNDKFECLLNDFRNEANDDWDVLGYIDNAGSGRCSMIVSDICGSQKHFKKGDPSFIPFDYSLLDKAQPIPPTEPDSP